jgi:hypothetical protein
MQTQRTSSSEPWLVQAKLLPAGQWRKIPHCAKDNSMRIENGQKGYRAYCFRCGDSSFVPHGDFDLNTLARRKTELEWRQDREIRLPSDFTTDIPSSEAVWLYRAGVSTAVAKHYKFGYSASLRRVILTIYNEGKLEGYTARSTINERPKYIEKVASPSSTVFYADTAIALPDVHSSFGTSRGLPDLVLTEDILSAVRVGRCVRNVVSILGTGLSAEANNRIHRATGLQTGAEIALWLDPDKAGRGASASIRRTLTLQGYNVREVKSTRDPKYYSNADIREMLRIDRRYSAQADAEPA